ncbi:hypothetical protein DL89DRAFT_327268, partial [Linderina pennispora]
MQQEIPRQQRNSSGAACNKRARHQQHDAACGHHRTAAQKTANRMSYAHQRSQSGWDKLFRNMSQRSDADGGTESRVPGIGEDTLLHEDVQYVDESDDAGDALALGGFPRGGVDNRGRSDTGASSTGSAIQYANSHIGSTTQLNTHYDIPPDPQELSQPPEKVMKPPPDDDEEHPTFLRNKSAADSEGLHRSSSAPSSASSSSSATGGEEDEEKTNKNKRMEELRHKFKRLSFPNGMFPFLQDALFVPMFYFMRDEHGHRAPPVIFDAISLAVTVSGTTFDSEDQHHFVVRIELQYGDIKWVIYRRLQDFITLHTMLTLRKFQGRVHKLPTFPQQFSYAIEKAKSFTPGHQRQALENYLIKVLRAMNMRPAYEICTFLELSAVSIVKDVGWKGKEGNWTGDHISDPYPTDVLFADSQFDIKFRKKTGRNPLFPYRITVSNQYRRIQLRSDSER